MTRPSRLQSMTAYILRRQQLVSGSSQNLPKFLTNLMAQNVSTWIGFLVFVICLRYSLEWVSLVHHPYMASSEHSNTSLVSGCRVSSRKFSLGGSSLGSSCYVSYTWSIACFSVVPSLACGAVMSLACHESAFAYYLILVVISLGGKLASLGGSFLPAPQ